VPQAGADHPSDGSETTTVMQPVHPDPDPDPDPVQDPDRDQDEDRGHGPEPASADSPRVERTDSSETTEILAPPGPERAAGADETAVLPPVPGTARDTDPADRVPPWLFRPEQPENERTREMPPVHPGGRPRPDWAEETPLDDLPTLADELLGGHVDEDDDPPAGRRR
jgi:dTMP kinase